MSRPRSQLSINIHIIPAGMFSGGWRGMEQDGRYWVTIDHYLELAKIAERGRFDCVFLSDATDWWPRAEIRPQRPLDPTLLMTAVAMQTECIGVMPTVSTTYNQPYEIARRLASLDHISGGRSAANFVVSTGNGSARNHGLDEPIPKEDRYARADEFMTVVKELWDSWTDEAVVADKETGIYVDLEQVGVINHRGRFFPRVDGPLIVHRPPQGHPVINQAGASDAGIALAAHHADSVFTMFPTIAAGLSYREKISAKMLEFGRDPADIRLFPGLVVIVGGTEREAYDRKAQIEALAEERTGVEDLAATVKIDAEHLHIDERFPWDLLEIDELRGVGANLMKTLLAEPGHERLTVRDVVRRLSGFFYHAYVVGAPEQIADAMEEWFDSGAVDGFNLQPDLLPSGLEAFVDSVVPLLQRRGLFRTDYEGATLRDHYGLPRPAGKTSFGELSAVHVGTGGRVGAVPVNASSAALAQK
jgi:FMN-dependent oxidoreductase (nitrilotriacetate monooxygenase family)